MPKKSSDSAIVAADFLNPGDDGGLTQELTTPASLDVLDQAAKAIVSEDGAGKNFEERVQASLEEGESLQLNTAALQQEVLNKRKAMTPEQRRRYNAKVVKQADKWIHQLKGGTATVNRDVLIKNYAYLRAILYRTVGSYDEAVYRIERSVGLMLDKEQGEKLLESIQEPARKLKLEWTARCKAGLESARLGIAAMKSRGEEVIIPKVQEPLSENMICRGKETIDLLRMFSAFDDYYEAMEVLRWNGLLEDEDFRRDLTSFRADMMTLSRPCLKICANLKRARAMALINLAEAKKDFGERFGLESASPAGRDLKESNEPEVAFAL
jgi:hypothetical protein